MSANIKAHAAAISNCSRCFSVKI